MSVKLAFLATLEAKEGKGGELAEFLRAGRELAVKEEGTVTWYAFKIDESHYGIFDTFETDDARNAHLNGAIPQALGTVPTTCWRASRRSSRSTSSRSSNRSRRGPRGGQVDRARAAGVTLRRGRC